MNLDIYDNIDSLTEQRAKLLLKMLLVARHVSPDTMSKGIEYTETVSFDI